MAPTNPREWLEIVADRDGEPHSYMLDITFLASTYKCSYGCGCKGAWGSKKEGCCATGPIVTTDDIATVDGMLSKLSPEFVDNYDDIMESYHFIRGSLTKDGVIEFRTRGGYCIFLNTGKKDTAPEGCALHAQALREGSSVLDSKPAICWQVPIHYSEGPDELTVTHWDRDEDFGWGDYEDGWWCVEDSANYQNSKQVWQSMSEELTRLLGEDVYYRLVQYMRSRNAHSFAERPQSVPVSIRKPQDTDSAGRRPVSVNSPSESILRGSGDK